MQLLTRCWHHTLKLTTTKGDRPTVVAVAPPTMQAVAVAIDGGDRGPLIVNQAGRRMTAYNIQYLVAALARDAAIRVHLAPHGLRHSASTTAVVVDGGEPVDVPPETPKALHKLVDGLTAMTEPLPTTTQASAFPAFGRP